MRLALLNGYPLELREIVHRPLTALAPHPGIFDPAKRRMRLIVDSGAVDVDRTRLQFERASTGTTTTTPGFLKRAEPGS